MKNLYKKPPFIFFLVLLIFSFGFIALKSVSAQTWDGPTASFPDGNPSVPIPSSVLSGSDPLDFTGGRILFSGDGRNVLTLGIGHNIKLGSHNLIPNEDGVSFNGLFNFDSGWSNDGGTQMGANSRPSRGLMFSFDTDRWYLYGREDSDGGEANELVLRIADNSNDRFLIEGENGDSVSSIADFSLSNNIRFFRNLDMNGNSIEGLNLDGGGITGSNYNISGVNQLSIDDPGEGINFHGAANIEVIDWGDDRTNDDLSVQSDGDIYLDSGSDSVKINNPSGGSSEIRFISGVNSGSDYGYIAGVDDYDGGTEGSSENFALVLRTENDGSGSEHHDDIVIDAAGETWIQPNGGNVGIGTTAPDATLDVEGDLDLNNNDLIGVATINGMTTDELGGSDLWEEMEDTNHIQNTNEGNIFVNGRIEAFEDTDYDPAGIYLDGENSAYVYGGSAPSADRNVILAHTGNSARGNVGIKTDDPESSLHVIGDIRLTESGGGVGPNIVWGDQSSNNKDFISFSDSGISGIHSVGWVALHADESDLTGDINSPSAGLSVSGLYTNDIIDMNGKNIIDGGQIYGTNFIDENNTNYYVNPSSDSVLKGNVTIGSGTGGTGEERLTLRGDHENMYFHIGGSQAIAFNAHYNGSWKYAQDDSNGNAGKIAFSEGSMSFQVAAQNNVDENDPVSFETAISINNENGDVSLHNNNLYNVATINGKSVDNLGSGEPQGYQKVSNSSNRNLDFAGDIAGLQAKCDLGQYVMGGGCRAGSSNYNLISSYPSSDDQNREVWQCQIAANRDGAGNTTMRAYAICAGESNEPTAGEVCQTNGGQPVNSSGNDVSATSNSYSFCKFNNASCPSGWSQNANWTSTQDKTCTPHNTDQCGSAVTAEGHDWQNEEPDSKGYYSGWNPMSGGCLNYDQCIAEIWQIGCTKN